MGMRGDQRSIVVRPAGRSRKSIVIRVVNEDLYRVRPAKPHRVLGDRLEDRLELETGVADRLDHLIRRRLLLEQRRVLARKSARLSFGRSFRSWAPSPFTYQGRSGGGAETGR